MCYMGSQLPKRGIALQFSAHVYCGQTVDHLSYCRALVQYTRGRNAYRTCRYWEGQKLSLPPPKPVSLFDHVFVCLLFFVLFCFFFVFLLFLFIYSYLILPICCIYWWFNCSFKAFWVSDSCCTLYADILLLSASCYGLQKYVCKLYRDKLDIKFHTVPLPTLLFVPQ